MRRAVSFSLVLLLLMALVSCEFVGLGSPASTTALTSAVTSAMTSAATSAMASVTTSAVTSAIPS
ncbi:MAG: hypothetical protein J6T24_04330, partial [Clostridia bacterium]|nr:hypothetical protein [Clostridia bacterium]